MIWLISLGLIELTHWLIDDRIIEGKKKQKQKNKCLRRQSGPDVLAFIICFPF